jgi:hypothetical protein
MSAVVGGTAAGVTAWTAIALGIGMLIESPF